MSNTLIKKIIYFAVIAAVLAGIYLLVKSPETQKDAAQTPVKKTAAEDFVPADETATLRLYFPINNKQVMEERKAVKKPGAISTAEAVVKEFLKGPANVRVSEMPSDTKLLGLYRGEDNILYIDLSDEFRRNFSGDISSELLLLQCLFESVMSNVLDIADVKVLIEGKEIESLGGHLYLMYPLREVIFSESSDSGTRKFDQPAGKRTGGI